MAFAKAVQSAIYTTSTLLHRLCGVYNEHIKQIHSLNYYHSNYLCMYTVARYVCVALYHEPLVENRVLVGEVPEIDE